MAVSAFDALADKGTGEFVPVRVWSCVVHDAPLTHECDCDNCKLPYYAACCATAEWVDKLDADGNVVMREVTMMDQFFTRAFVLPEMQKASALAGMMDRFSDSERIPVIRWTEDDTVD